MAVKTVQVPDIGTVLLSKRKNTKHLRLSISAKGEIRVGMPYWLPYSAGILFASKRREWIKKHLLAHKRDLISPGSLVGKSHRVTFKETPNEAIRTRVTENEILIYTNLAFNHSYVQEKLTAAAEKALKNESEELIARRLEVLSKRYNYPYNGLKIKKLTGRWGSCSNHKQITISIYLIQLPWELIDYVLVHELIHTKHLHHGKPFWNAFQAAIPTAKQRRKSIRLFRPHIIPSSN